MLLSDECIGGLVFIAFNHLSWRMLGQETAQAKVNRQEAAVVIEAWDVIRHMVNTEQDVLDYSLR